MKTIRFLQVAIAQFEMNNKLGGYYHCSIGLDLDTNELTRLYPVQLNTMYKHCVYDIQVEPMTCKRERSYKPIKIRFLRKQQREDTDALLNRIPVTTIDRLNDDRLSMGVIDASKKKILVQTNMQEVYCTQALLFDDLNIPQPVIRSHADTVHKDIRIQFEDKRTDQGYRNLSYNESHFYIGLERNGALPKTYNGPQWNRLIVGNLRNHRSTFIGLCLFKGNYLEA